MKSRHTHHVRFMSVSALVFALGLSTVPLSSLAGPHAEALSACLANATSGKDRKELARWVFVAMSSHPEISSLSTVTPDVRDKTDQNMGRLVTRLLSEDCTTQAKAALEKEGNTAMRTAFEALGRLAMQELMTNKAVGAGVSGFEKYVDKAKLDAKLKSGNPK